MKKFLVCFFCVLIVLFAGVYFSLDIIVKHAVERFTPEVIGVPVHLKSVSIKPFKGDFSLSGLTISNPKGYNEKNAFSVEKIAVNVDMKSLFGKTIVVKNVLIDRPEASVEINKKDTNIGQIKKNIDAFIQKSSSSDQKQASTSKTKTSDEKKSSSKNVVIKNLDIKNTSVTAGAFGVAAKVELPNVNQKNIGEGSQKTPAQMLADVFSILSESVLQGYSKLDLKEGKKIIDDAGATIKKGIKSFKDLF